MLAQTSIDLNKSECLQHTRHIGFDRIYNVCANKITDVPWGSIDWLSNISMAFALIFVACLLVGLVFMVVYMVNDVRND